jgi:GGDEF domain-containing protein
VASVQEVNPPGLEIAEELGRGATATPGTLSRAGTAGPRAGRSASGPTSVGIAYHHPADRDLGALLSRADRALYVAKEQGRDRVAAA